MLSRPTSSPLDRLRELWREAEGEGEATGVSELLNAVEDDRLLADLVSSDAAERRARGLPAGLEWYADRLENIHRYPEVVDQLLILELLEDGAEGIAARRADLQRRQPNLEDRIELLAEFCTLAEARDDPPEHIAHYELMTRLGSGTFGTVWKAWDSELRRFVALKVMQPREELELGVGLDSILDEARCAAAIDHPNVVAVHRAGYDPEQGLFWIDSQLIAPSAPETSDATAGRPLDVLYHGGGEVPSPRRAAAIVLDVARGVAAAHACGVIHRDLKPSNILIGVDGRAMVADFGLASTAGFYRPAEAPPKKRPNMLQSRSDGIVGTPLFMAPEQARPGARPTERVDVYGLGGLLAWLLTGHAPADRGGADDDVEGVLARVAAGDVGLRWDAPGAAAPKTLVAIAKRALAVEPSDRYGSADAFARDVEAYLDHRPTWADPPGVWRSAALLVRRNRAVAVITATALCLGITLVVAFMLRLNARIRAFEQMADVRRAVDLRQSERYLWPRRPERVAAMDAWLAEAQRLVDRRPLHEQALTELGEESREPVPLTAMERWLAHSSSAMKFEDDQVRLQFVRDRLSRSSASGPEVRQELEREVGVLEKRIEEHRKSYVRRKLRRLSRDQDVAAWRRDVLKGHLKELDRLDDMIAKVRARREFALTVRKRTVDDAAEVWSALRKSVLADERFHLDELNPIVGLIPIGQDPRSGFWELGHIGTGTPPKRDGKGRLVITEDTGVVFVLLPGGDVWIGADPDPSSSRGGVQPLATEGPRHRVHLAPFLISKYELTQSQWFRITGERPSYLPFGATMGGVRFTGAHPVELVTWNAAMQVLARVGMTLPTEAQWEYAASGGTRTPWWTGKDAVSLSGRVNLADRAWVQAVAAEAGASSRHGGDMRLDDGFPFHSPVDALAPNPFGLHGVLGNVAEWCRDWYQNYRDLPAIPGTGRRLRPLDPETRLKVIRGGDYQSGPVDSRTTVRGFATPESRSNTVGLRPCMVLD